MYVVTYSQYSSDNDLKEKIATTFTQITPAMLNDRCVLWTYGMNFVVSARLLIF